MIHPIKRFVQKVAIKVIKATDPNKMSKPHSDYETESVAICRKLISKPDTTLLISPISGKRYIKSDDNQLFIIVELNQLTIVNHAYSYNIRLDTKGYQKIVTVFDAEVEKRREKMEQEIRSNVKHSLEQIYKNILNEQV